MGQKISPLSKPFEAACAASALAIGAKQTQSTRTKTSIVKKSDIVMLILWMPQRRSISIYALPTLDRGMCVIC